jgi:hypothetical protein
VSIAALIKKFDVRTTVPVDVNDVVAEIKARGIKDEITFWPVTLEVERLKGQMVQIDEWVEPGYQGAPSKTWVDIYYANGMADDEKRHVSCKELLHILDPAHCYAATEAEISRLFSKIGLPPHMQDPFKDGAPVNADRVAEFEAAAILFPWSARQLLMRPYTEGKITLGDIARLVDIPITYVALIMHESWDNLHTILTSEGEGEQV